MKLSDFQLGLMQFLTILLPGAVVAWLLWKLAVPVSAPGAPVTPASLRRLVPADPTAAWIGLGIVALLLGQALERIGAILCDPAFDAFRKRGVFGASGAGHADYLAMREVCDVALGLDPLRPREAPGADGQAPWAAALLDRSGLAAAWRKDAPRLRGKAPVNVYQFACAVLRARAPLAWMEVERIQALSKLFRTLTVGALAVFCGILTAEPATRTDAWGLLPAPAFLVAIALTFACYGVLRQESIARAYRFALLALVLPETAGGKPADKPQAE